MPWATSLSPGNTDSPTFYFKQEKRPLFLEVTRGPGPLLRFTAPSCVSWWNRSRWVSMVQPHSNTERVAFRADKITGLTWPAESYGRYKTLSHRDTASYYIWEWNIKSDYLHNMSHPVLCRKQWNNVFIFPTLNNNIIKWRLYLLCVT